VRTQRKALRLEVAEPSVCTLSDIGWHVRTDSRARASTRQLSRSPSLNTSKMSGEPLAREREPIERVRARLEAPGKQTNATS
jgi:hypothetical protein